MGNYSKHWAFLCLFLLNAPIYFSSYFHYLAGPIRLTPMLLNGRYDDLIRKSLAFSLVRYSLWSSVLLLSTILTPWRLLECTSTNFLHTMHILSRISQLSERVCCTDKKNHILVLYTQAFKILMTGMSNFMLVSCKFIVRIVLGCINCEIWLIILRILRDSIYG